MRRGFLLLPLLAACRWDNIDYLPDGPGPDSRNCLDEPQEPPDSCPSSGCPQTFTLDPAKICPSEPKAGLQILVWTSCNDGLELIEYLTDVGQLIYYRASDGTFIGYGRFSAHGATCVAGVPQGFSLVSCSGHTSILCDHP